MPGYSTDSITNNEEVMAAIIQQTLQMALSSHTKYCTIVSCTIASCLHHSGEPAQPKPALNGFTLPAPV